jgi:hypothetical protein
MTRLFRSLCGSASCQVLIGVAGLLFATRPAESQSEPARVIVSCPPGNQSAAFKPFSTLYSRGESVQTDAVVSTVSTVIQEVQRTSFPELAHVDLRVRIFGNHADYFRTRFSFSRFLLFMPMQYFTDCTLLSFKSRRRPMAFVRFSPTNWCTLPLSAAATAFADSVWSVYCQSGRLPSSSAALTWRPSIEGTEMVSKVIANGSTRTSHPTNFRRSGATTSLLRRLEPFRFSWKNNLNYLFWRAHVPMSLREIQKN